MGLTLTIPPNSPPVALADVKAHARIEHDEEDDLIASYLAAAVAYAQDFTGRQLMLATYEQTLGRFPAANGPIELERPPLKQVTEITYLDAAGDSQTLDLANVVVDPAEVFAQVHPKRGFTWPVTQRMHTTARFAHDGAYTPPESPAVTVTFEAGYESAEKVPDTLKQAIRILAAHWYEHREPILVGASVSNIPHSVDSLLWMERVLRAA